MSEGCTNWDYRIEVVSFKQMDHSDVTPDILYVNKNTELSKWISIWVRDFKIGYNFHYQMHLKQANKNFFEEWRINVEIYKSHKSFLDLDLTIKMNLADPFCSLSWQILYLTWRWKLDFVIWQDLRVKESWKESNGLLDAWMF